MLFQYNNIIMCTTFCRKLYFIACCQERNIEVKRCQEMKETSCWLELEICWVNSCGGMERVVKGTHDHLLREVNDRLWTTLDANFEFILELNGLFCVADSNDLKKCNNFCKLNSSDIDGQQLWRNFWMQHIVITTGQHKNITIWRASWIYRSV